MTEEGVFSRVVRVDSLPREGQVVTIEASPAEREALAAFYKLPAIAVLTATLRINPAGRGGARVTGVVHGELTQVCVVSAGAVSRDRRRGRRRAVRPAGSRSRFRGLTAAEEAQTFSLSDEDEPDPVIDGKIDLGALISEFFALGLDPYPRKPGAVFEEDAKSEPADSPFSALAPRDKPGRE